MTHGRLNFIASQFSNPKDKECRTLLRHDVSSTSVVWEVNVRYFSPIIIVSPSARHSRRADWACSVPETEQAQSAFKCDLQRWLRIMQYPSLLWMAPTLWFSFQTHVWRNNIHAQNIVSTYRYIVCFNTGILMHVVCFNTGLCYSDPEWSWDGKYDSKIVWLRHRV